MGVTHRATLADRLSTAELQEFQQNFHNPDMQAITSDYVFTKPFQQDPTNRHTEGLDEVVAGTLADTKLLAEISRLRARFNEAREGVVHGDLHTGSVMVNGQDTRVIDGEFAFYGPVAFDLGSLVANYLLAWYAHPVANRPALMRCIEACWQAYAERFDLPDRSKSIWRDAIQFAGVEMLRRMLGAAHVGDLESIESIADRVAAETCAIACARVLILNPPEVESLTETTNRFA